MRQAGGHCGLRWLKRRSGDIEQRPGGGCKPRRRVGVSPPGRGDSGVGCVGASGPVGPCRSLSGSGLWLYSEGGEASEGVGRGGMGPGAAFKGSSRVEGLKGPVESSGSPLPSWRVKLTGCLGSVTARAVRGVRGFWKNQQPLC